MRKEIIPTILVKTEEELMERVCSLEQAASKAQVDVIDPKFAPNKTIAFSNFKKLKTKLKLEIHLMVPDPEDYIKACKEIKASKVIVHFESYKNNKKLDKLIKDIKKNKMKAGIAINPGTPVSKIAKLAKSVDTVLVMTVNPGFSGQGIIPSTLGKVQELRKISKKINIEVDGGINQGNIRTAWQAGANLFAVGSAVSGKDAKQSILKLKKELR